MAKLWCSGWLQHCLLPCWVVPKLLWYVTLKHRGWPCVAGRSPGHTRHLRRRDVVQSLGKPICLVFAVISLCCLRLELTPRMHWLCLVNVVWRDLIHVEVFVSSLREVIYVNKFGNMLWSRVQMESPSQKVALLSVLNIRPIWRDEFGLNYKTYF